MRVLHLPVGRQMHEMCAALNKHGVEAASCHFRDRSTFGTPDICLHLDKLSGPERLRRRETFLAEAAAQYDIFHFHFGETFMKDHSDLAYLKQLGKKLIVQHRGSDVRRLSVARRRGNVWVRVKPGKRRTDAEIRHKLKLLSRHIDDVIVADKELHGYVHKRYKRIHLLRQFITLDKFKPIYPSANNDTPLIVHAPTNVYLKGTAFIEQAIARLRRRGIRFEYRRIEGLRHEEAIGLYRRADIFIDQLLQGSFGVAALEGMALGKPVVCYIEDNLKATYPPGLPIVSANPDSCYDVLKKLLRRPRLRRCIGKAGRRYIRRYYDADKLAKQLIAIYNKL